MKKHWMIISIAILAALLAAGCSIGQSDNSSDTDSSDTQSDIEVKLGSDDYQNFKDACESNGIDSIDISLTTSDGGSTDTSLSGDEADNLKATLDGIKAGDQTDKPDGDTFVMTFNLKDGSSYKFTIVGDTQQIGDTYYKLDDPSALLEYKDFIKTMLHD